MVSRRRNGSAENGAVRTPRRGRERLTPGLLLLLLGLAGAAAWLTRHPEWRGLERAAEWPLVGPLAARFRAAYLPPPPAPAARPDEPPRWVVSWEEAAPSSRGQPARPRPAPAEEVPAAPEPPPAPLGESWARPGSGLRERPEATAEIRERLRDWALLAVLERRGEWVAVGRGGRRLWLEAAAFSAPDERPFGSAPLPVGPGEPAPPAPERLAEARRLLGPAVREMPLGGYLLLTDLPAADLPPALGAAVAALEPAYRERTGLTPVGAAAGVIVLFASEAAYRTFQAGEERLAGLPVSGHAHGGLVALPAAAGEDETAAVLTHELVHLLNQRAIGPALPPWLDEGLAEELAGSARDAAGRSDPGGYGGRLERDGRRWSATGGLAALFQAARVLEADPGPLLPALLEREWTAFVRGPDAPASYALSFLFVRFLLVGEEGALAPGFRAFLAAVAAGGPATPPALAAQLGREWPALEAALRAFVAAEAERELAARSAPPRTGWRRLFHREGAGPGPQRPRAAGEPSAAP